MRPLRCVLLSHRVNVQDINEFAPMFSEDQYSGSVAENQDTSVFVLQVQSHFLKILHPLCMLYCMSMCNAESLCVLLSICVCYLH